MPDVQQRINPAGGAALVYSDGLSDAMESEAGDDVRARVCGSMAAAPGATAQGICDRLWEEAQAAEAHLQAQPDDFVLVAVKQGTVPARP